MDRPGRSKLLAWIAGLSPGVTVVTVVAGILAVGAVDYATGVEIRVYPLYFVPIAVASWRLGVGWALGGAALGTAVWLASNALGGRQYASGVVWAVNASTQLLAFSFVALLISRTRGLLREVEALSRVDPLTGLHNVRSFHDRAGALVSACHREGRPVTIAYLDLDNFKCVNDRLGHARGDEVLRDVARVLAEGVRASDVVARLGGDEFAILLPETDGEGARVLLERMKASLKGRLPAEGCEVSMSIGAIAFGRAPDDLGAALRSADALMYDVKHLGKDAVRVESRPA